MDGWTVFKATFLHYQGWIGPGTTLTNEMSWDETLPQCSIDRSTLHTAAHRATSELAAAPSETSEGNIQCMKFLFKCEQYQLK